MLRAFLLPKASQVPWKGFCSLHPVLGTLVKISPQEPAHSYLPLLGLSCSVALLAAMASLSAWVCPYLCLSFHSQAFPRFGPCTPASCALVLRTLALAEPCRVSIRDSVEAVQDFPSPRVCIF